MVPHDKECAEDSNNIKDDIPQKWPLSECKGEREHNSSHHYRSDKDASTF